jgi:hypothetical protein
MRSIQLLIGWLCFLAVAASAFAQSAEPTVTLKNLNHPCGISFRPGGTADRYDVFIAETGAGRVVRWSTSAPEQANPVIEGFDSGKAFDRFAPRGPVALWFLDPGMLVVGTAAAKADDVLRNYELPEEGETLAATDAASSARSGGDNAVCLSITRSRANEFVTDALLLATRDAKSGRLMKARIQAGIVGKMRPFLATEAEAQPLAVATSPAGRIVVADDGGGLTFYNPIDGDAELRLTTELKQIAGLAYSPTTNSLYAADFQQGLYRIDDASEPGHPACKAVQIAAVKEASALAIAPDGSLYLVTFGDGKTGTLQVLTGNL